MRMIDGYYILAWPGIESVLSISQICEQSNERLSVDVLLLVSIYLFASQFCQVCLFVI